MYFADLFHFWNTCSVIFKQNDKAGSLSLSTEFVHVGCSLKFLLDWVWSRVAEIKNNIDNSCKWFSSTTGCLYLETLQTFKIFCLWTVWVELSEKWFFCLIGVTLYDWSGIPLDRRALQTLYQSNQRLGSILAIIKALISQSAPTTEEGRLLQMQWLILWID